MRDFLKTWFLTNFDERKFSCGFSFEATRLDVHATPNLFVLQRFEQEIKANFVRCVISSRKVFPICTYLSLLCNTVFPYNVVFLHILSRENYPVRSLLRLHVQTYTSHQIFSSYNVLFRRYKIILQDALLLLVKCFQYIGICLYSAKLYFLMKWYSYIFFLEKTLLCLLF